jgi:hypothetical protein
MRRSRWYNSAMAARRLAGCSAAWVAALAALIAGTPANAAIVDLAAPDIQPSFFSGTPHSFALGQSGSASTPLDVFVSYGQFGNSTVQVRNPGVAGNWRMGLGVSIQNISTPGLPSDIDLTDVTADGSVDIAVAYDGGVALASGAANGSYSAFSTPAGSTPATMTGVALAPLNANASPDLVAIGPSKVDVYLNTGNPLTPFNTRSQFDVEAGATGLAAGDLDGDGDADAATAVSSSRRAIVLLNNGSGNLTLTRSAGLFTRPEAVLIANVDGAGRPELLVTEPDRDTVAIVSTANLPTSLGPIQRIATGVAPADVAAGDLDGDGRPEIVTANAGSDTITVAELGGASRTFAAGSSPVGVAIGEVTGDGRPDVVVANDGTLGVSVLANLGVPPAPPPPPPPDPPAIPVPTPVVPTPTAVAPPVTPTATLRCSVKRKAGEARIVCTAALSDPAAAQRLSARLLRKGRTRTLASARAAPGKKLTFAVDGGLKRGNYVVRLSVTNTGAPPLSAQRSVTVPRRR